MIPRNSIIDNKFLLSEKLLSRHLTKEVGNGDDYRSALGRKLIANALGDIDLLKIMDSGFNWAVSRIFF